MTFLTRSTLRLVFLQIIVKFTDQSVTMETVPSCHKISTLLLNGKPGVAWSFTPRNAARSAIKHLYTLKGHTLKTQEVTKYLSVDLQSNLSWKIYIDRISKKANSMLGFLRHNLRASSEDTKANAYYSMVQSILDYCTSEWNPHHKDHIRKLGMV